MDYLHHYDSPLGAITVASDGASVTGLWFDGQKYYGSTLGPAREEKDLPIFAQTDKWLDLYFRGKEPDFTPPVYVHTTVFRGSVFEVLLTIPYGKTMTYGQIAQLVSKEKRIALRSARAVGGAVAHNPISLLIPCHRVVGADGSLTGYAGGIERKIKLLELEKADLSAFGRYKEGAV